MDSELFGLVEPSVQLVVLNACYSDWTTFNPAPSFQSMQIASLRLLQFPAGNPDAEWSVRWGTSSATFWMNGIDGGPNGYDADIVRLATAPEVGYRIACETVCHEMPFSGTTTVSVPSLNKYGGGTYAVAPLFGVSELLSAGSGGCTSSVAAPQCSIDPPDDGHGYEVDIQGQEAGSSQVVFTLMHTGAMGSTIKFTACIIGRP